MSKQKPNNIKIQKVIDRLADLIPNGQLISRMNDASSFLNAVADELEELKKEKLEWPNE